MGDAADDAVDVAGFVGDPVGDFAEQRIRQTETDECRADKDEKNLNHISCSLMKSVAGMSQT